MPSEPVTTRVRWAKPGGTEVSSQLGPWLHRQASAAPDAARFRLQPLSPLAAGRTREALRRMLLMGETTAVGKGLAWPADSSKSTIGPPLSPTEVSRSGAPCQT